MAAGEDEGMSVSVDADRVQEPAWWYHTMDLRPGETTRGFFDLRGLAGLLPEDLSGKRCLDACSATGFWAFEMEKRGASEVVALDVASYTDKDWRMPWLAPHTDEVQGEAFHLAKEALGSKVQRVERSVYDVTPDELGSFDFVFIGSVLLHLRDPVRALRALRAVTGGELMSFEPILVGPSLLHPRSSWGRMASGADARWWTPNAFAHKQWLVAGGFEVTASSWHRQPFGRLHARLPRRLPTTRDGLAFWLFSRHFGVLSQRLSCRPLPLVP